MKKFHLMIVLAAFAMASPLAKAQTADTLRLSADDCVRIALSTNPTIKVADISEVFLKDIERLYPEIQHECHERERLFLRELISLIESGQKEGVFRGGFNAEVAAILFSLQMRSVKSTMSSFPKGTSLIEVLDTMFINFIRGIASDKDIKIIDKVLADHNIKP